MTRRLLPTLNRKREDRAEESVSPRESAEAILPLLRHACHDDEETLRQLVFELHKLVIGPCVVMRMEKPTVNLTTVDGKPLHDA